MRWLASVLTVFLFCACDDDAGDEPERDAGIDAGRDAALDAARDASPDASDGSALDAAPTVRVDSTCFSAVRPPDLSKPDSRDKGCNCNPTVEDEIYCMPGTFLLSCSAGKWTEGRDGPCWTGRDPVPKTCEQQGWSPRPSTGCPAGYGSVAPDIGPDGGIASPACCDNIEVRRETCLGGGFHIERVTAGDNLTFLCRDGSQVRGFILDSNEGCCL